MNLENPKYRGILQLNFEVVQITTWFQGWQHFHKSCWVTSTWGMRYLSIDERPWGTVELVNIMHHGYPHRYLERMTKKRVRGLLWDQQILARFFGALVFKTWFCITWFWPWMCWCFFSTLFPICPSFFPGNMCFVVPFISCRPEFRTCVASVAWQFQLRMHPEGPARAIPKVIATRVCPLFRSRLHARRSVAVDIVDGWILAGRC